MYRLPQSACRHRRGADIGQLAGITPRHRDDQQVDLRISLNSVERWADGAGSFRGRAGQHPACWPPSARPDAVDNREAQWRGRRPGCCPRWLRYVAIALSARRSPAPASRV